MSLKRCSGVDSPVSGKRELVAHLRLRLEDCAGEGVPDPREAEYRELAEAYLLLDGRMAKLISISDKYQVDLLETTRRLREALGELETRGEVALPAAPETTLTEEPNFSSCNDEAASLSQLDPFIDRLKAKSSVDAAISPADLALLIRRYERLDARMRKIVTISDRYQEQLREATKRMQYMAKTDPLTNLSNRRDMLECLDREVERFVRYEKDFSIIMFDIDDFKRVNDSYGHDAGDRVLKGLALVFLETLRRTDVCSRWGGEEFLVLCPETTSESARIVGEKCFMAVSAMQVATEAGPVGITLSGGVAAMQKGFDRDDLIKLADAKLYAAKAAGKKRIVD